MGCKEPKYLLYASTYGKSLVDIQEMYEKNKMDVKGTN